MIDWSGESRFLASQPCPEADAERAGRSPDSSSTKGSAGAPAEPWACLRNPWGRLAAGVATDRRPIFTLRTRSFTRNTFCAILRFLRRLAGLDNLASDQEEPPSQAAVLDLGEGRHELRRALILTGIDAETRLHPRAHFWTC